MKARQRERRHSKSKKKERKREKSSSMPKTLLKERDILKKIQKYPQIAVFFYSGSPSSY